jgi:signal peptidase II
LAKSSEPHKTNFVLAPRWRTLILIAASVFLLDQWTKLLAVKHLTPGIALARQSPTSPIPVDQDGLDALLEKKGAFEQVADFYGTRSPCDRWARCPRVRVIEGFWDWRYVENPGAAWSLFAKTDPRFRVLFLTIVSIAAIGFIVVFVRRLPAGEKTVLIALSLIMGGALGNLLDRTRLGYVIDFIEWYAGAWHWPTFNVADSAISSGIVLLVLNSLLDLVKRRHKPNESLASSTS